MAKDSPLLEGFKEILSGGLFSDLVVICGNKSFNVHKNVLHAMSPVFRKMLTGEFKEAKQGSITLEHDEPDIIASMLHFFYNAEILSAATAATAADQDTIKAEGSYMVKVYAIADKYDVPSLRHQATTQLAGALRLERKQTHLKELIATIRAIDEHTADSTLWKIVIPEIIRDLGWLSQDNDFSVLLQEMPALTKALLTSTAKGLEASNSKAAFAQDVVGYLETEADINYYGAKRTVE
ncbi:hypothetical protein LTR56_013973 [Elasticomyces elasticus]|nr:hypothetical protein LTR56_013973 [Elasticomyces elasticus]KAK3656719.1 hypothetical protein LTR22_009698 [Elasticomyces elasticus]KAK4921591.1 hypothetical protein LTR49_011061 [Elasticomyces elasticus]KAK5760279.1 hypothetical protein LTS12_009663 [Elasticomyces elasticus]